MQREPGTSILFFLGIVGLTLFGLGWAIDNDVSLPEPQELIEQLEQLPIMNSPQASPQAQVVVLPNSTPNQIVLPNGDLPEAVTIPQPVTVPQPVTIPQPVSRPVILKEAQPAIQTPNTITVTATAQPIITVTATLQPIITVTATTEPVIIVTATPIPATATAAIATATSAAATVTAMNIITSGHCSEWTVGGCGMTEEELATPAIYWPTVTVGPSPTAAPTRTLQPTYAGSDTPEVVSTIVYPTSTATATPENNEITSIVTLQGATNHAGIIVNAVGLGGLEWHEHQMPGEAITDEMGKFKISGLSRGRYKLTAYTTTGSHIPACLEIDLSGVGSIVIPQTMLSNGGLEAGEGDGDNLNLMAAAVFHYRFGLEIPEHLIPILDVSGDGIFDLTDYNMVAAEPSLMGCRDW